MDADLAMVAFDVALAAGSHLFDDILVTFVTFAKNDKLVLCNLGNFRLEKFASLVRKSNILLFRF